MKNTQRAFTLIELLVVIAIIGVLAGIILSSLGGARDKSLNSRINSMAMEYSNAVELARAGNNDLYPYNSTNYTCFNTSATSCGSMNAVGNYTVSSNTNILNAGTSPISSVISLPIDGSSDNFIDFGGTISVNNSPFTGLNLAPLAISSIKGFRGVIYRGSVSSAFGGSGTAGQEGFLLWVLKGINQTCARPKSTLNLIQKNIPNDITPVATMCAAVLQS